MESAWVRSRAPAAREAGERGGDLPYPPPTILGWWACCCIEEEYDMPPSENESADMVRGLVEAVLHALSLRYSTALWLGDQLACLPFPVSSTFQNREEAEAPR